MEFICRCRLADKLQVQFINGRDAGGAVRGGETLQLWQFLDNPMFCIVLIRLNSITKLKTLTQLLTSQNKKN